MNNKMLSYLMICVALVILACNEEDSLSKSKSNEQISVSSKSAATQLDGIGFLATDAECDSPSEGATYAITMTGDLEGCLFIYVDEYTCSPSGTYREIGREYFVGTYHGQAGSFWTTYKFEAKYEGCAEDGSYIGAEILGRCQHPVVEGSGTGVFEGVTGRLDMKDDIDAGNYPFRGHLKF